jgi:glycosyltransferase involved in cell wall biosynthesis
MNILKIIHGYPPKYNAGSEVYSQSICNELIRQNHDITILTREEVPYRVDFEFRQIREHQQLQFYYVNMPRDKDGYQHDEIDIEFGKLLEKERPDIAHVGHLNHLSTGLITELKKAKIPIVFTLHDFWLMCPRGQFLQRNYDGCHTYELCTGQEDKKCATSCYRMFFSGEADFYEQDLNYWTNWMSRRMKTTNRIISMVDLFIAPSKYLMNRFTTDFKLPENKITYLDYGFPTHYLQPMIKNKKTNVFTFGYIGTHIPAKGINLLIEAFQGIKGPAKLKIWGWKDTQSQKALLAMTEPSANSIEFCGGYINENLAEVVFSQVDAIVVPSIWGENSPLVIHEAQACHIPVITANYGGMAEYVEHQVNGLLFDHRNMLSLSSQMQWASDHSDEMVLLGKKGYLYSNDGQVPNIQQHCSQLEKIYQNIISNYG